jgi:hypothetical protein
MSENFGVKPGFEQKSTQPGDSSYNNLVENHAVQLMDELFHDLDSRSESLSQPSAKPSSPQPARSAASQLALAVKTDELQDNLLIPYVEMDAILQPFHGAESVPVLLDEAEPSSSFLLSGLAWGAFLGSISLFAFTQFSAFTRSPATVQAAVPVVAAAQPQDVAFAAEVSELLQSTENILPSPSPLAVSALPPSLTQTSIPAVVPSVAQPLVPSTLPGGVPIPSKSVGIGQQSQAVGNPKTQTNQKTQTINLSKLNNRLPVLKGNQNQIATSYIPPALPLNPTPQSLPMAQQTKSGITIHTILDLGSRSAILISRNGSTQSIRPGEVLDSTGWVFVQVNAGQAILQRGNETRTVGIGEQF